jgi:hypothetical protein
MLFGKKKMDDLIIQCSVCEWNPDGGIHWACSCGHRWNTFETKGKCPKCGIQWKDTWCPACGKGSPHSDWYKTKEDIERIENSGDKRLRAKKKSLESKLISYGIRNVRISHLPYLDPSSERFHTPYEAGCRMLILYAIGSAAHSLDERPSVIGWLKEENLWNKVSPAEKEFLMNPSPSEEVQIDYSWNVEGALVLAWCLNKVSALPRLDDEDSDDTIEELQKNIPEIGDSTLLFRTRLEYRSLDEIYEENLLNELATSYFRDLLFNGKEDATTINRAISFERHKTLNWLRTFYEGDDEVTGELWDDVDTST